VTPLPRQTVDRCAHPTLGEGRAVYDNGPAFFVADSGEVVPMARIGGGGCGPEGSYRYGVTADGEHIRLDTTKRPRGDWHTRAETSFGQRGWLVYVAGASRGVYRWEPDDGAPVEMTVHTMHVGTPDEYAEEERNMRRKKPKPLIETEWRTLIGDRGPFIYRRVKEGVK